MKIAVSAIGPSINDLVKARLGRAPFFRRTHIDTKVFENARPGYQDYRCEL